MKAWIDREVHVETPAEVGVLARVLGAVSKAGVGMQAMTAYEQSGKGHFILLTSDSGRTARALHPLNFNVMESDVVVAEFDDQKGMGALLAEKLARAGINVNYTYSGGKGKNVLLVLSTGDNAGAVQVLSSKSATGKGKTTNKKSAKKI